MGYALIVGCGFTGSRVLRALALRDWEAIGTRRSVDRSDASSSRSIHFDLNDPSSLANFASAIRPDTVVLHSIPVPGLVPTLRMHPPARVVYLSTTGVYGKTDVVDERTAIAPQTEREILRAAEEHEVLSGPWSAMVLRPAAIYGPGRGIHSAMRADKYKLMGEGENYVSRIHVDDLAAITVAAMLSDLTGAFPVADCEPCSSREIAAYCARLLSLPMPDSVSSDSLSETRRANRRVDGSAIRKLLGVELRYPSYREGIPACLEEEGRAFSMS